MKKSVCVVMIIAAAWMAHADSYTWSPSSGTLFQEAANWTPSTSVPGVSDTAIFSGANSYAVTFSGNVTNTSAAISTPSPGTDVTFGLNGWLWKLTGALSFGGAGSATFGGGSLEVANDFTVGANQKLILNNDTSVFSGKVSVASGGSVEVGGGSHGFGPLGNSGKGLYLNGAPPSGGVSFRMTNGTVSVPGPFWVSVNSFAKISLEGGTLLSPAGAYGTVIDGPATINVHTNATVDHRSGTRFYVGRQRGETVLNILGGVVTNTGAPMQIGSSYANSSTGIVNLVDGVFWSTPQVYFGGNSGASLNSVGILNQSGGKMRMNYQLLFGYNTASEGIYNLEGGSAWCNSIWLGNNNGSGSRGSVYLKDGTLALGSLSYIGVGSGCTGYVYQTGGELLSSNSLVLGLGTNAFGLYNYQGGNALVNGSVHLGYGIGGRGRMVIDGSDIFVRDNVVVGSGISSTGTLVVAGGSFVRPWLQDIALYPKSVGEICVTGGELVFSNEVHIGAAEGAFGRVYLTDGLLQSEGETTRGLCVGFVGGATGELVVAGGELKAMSKYSILAGVGSNSVGSVIISGGTNDIRSLRIGHIGGQGLLRITGGQTYVTNTVDYTFTFGNGQLTPLARFELAGGVLTVREINAGYDYSEALFDGGVLQCAIDTAVLFRGFNQATLTERGAVIDTAGYSATIAQTLSNEVGYAGSFTVRGLGKLTLSSAGNAFTGRVTVEQGELATGVGGTIRLNGGVAIDAGGVLNLSAGSLRDFTTDPGTLSRIDGTLRLKAGGTLTNGVGATLCGSGVVTGSVVFASGSAWAHNKAWGPGSAGPLRVTGDTIFEAGSAVALTGYSLEDLSAGVPLVEAVGSGTLQLAGLIPVTLDSVSHPYWRIKTVNNGKVLTAAFVPRGTMLLLR